jgi:SAM-dependent methyltransferase
MGRPARRRQAWVVALCFGLWASEALGLAVRREGGGGKVGGGRGGGGFAGRGGDSSTKEKRGLKKRNPSSPELTPVAKALLNKHHNNVDAASTEYYTSQLQKLTSAATNDGAGAGSSSLSTTTASPPPSWTAEERHRLRLQAAWDAVALFLPVDYQRTGGRVDPFVQRRLSMIAASCCIGGGGPSTESPIATNGAPGSGGGGSLSLLDVGCGDGGIVPYLDRTRIALYLGIDVSPEMIALGRRRHPSEKFLVGCFPDDLLTTRDQKSNADGFDCVLFNGSLQFFADPKVALGQAKSLLHFPSEGAGRIVIAHAMGSKFVANECRTSPSVALSRLPPMETTLRDIADELGMRVMTKQELLRGFDGLTLQESDVSESNFYLAALTF